MKTSVILKAAKPLLMRADNPFGEAHILDAIGRVNQSDKASKILIEAMTKLAGRPCYSLSEGLRRAGWIPKTRRASDPMFWPTRDSWVDRFIIEREKIGD